MPFNLWGHTLPEMEKWVLDNNFPRFRAKQIQDYLYKRYIFDIDGMRQLKESMRSYIKS